MVICFIATYEYFAFLYLSLHTIREWNLSNGLNYLVISRSKGVLRGFSSLLRLVFKAMDLHV